ncbi:MAG: tripartite tricarboxylate transporter substrate binding protein [Burkholderiales bacterium]
MRLAILLLSVFPIAGASAPATAAGYPERPIRIVVPFPPGGTPDVNARAVAEPMERTLGQNLVIDNRAGANGIIGAELVKRAAPDGYTFLFTSVSFVVNPSVQKTPAYDVLRDFAPVTNVAIGLGYVIVANSAVPARTVKELIALAKSAAKPLAYGSSGVGNPQHLAGELFNLRAGTSMLHVPYKGAAQSMTALLGGDEVQLMFMPPTSALPHVKSGRLRVLAYTAANRWSAMPDVPTVGEAGVSGFVFDGAWHGIFAPARTPEAILVRFQSAVRQSIQTPKVREFLVAGGFDPVGNTPAEFRAFIATEIVKWGNLVRLAKVTPE